MRSDGTYWGVVPPWCRCADTGMGPARGRAASFASSASRPPAISCRLRVSSLSANLGTNTAHEHIPTIDLLTLIHVQWPP